jgi:hypothetical protein
MAVELNIGSFMLSIRSTFSLPCSIQLSLAVELDRYGNQDISFPLGAGGIAYITRKKICC